MSKITVEESSLVSIANKIRAKSGTTGKLVFPTGFENMIANLPSSQYYASSLTPSSNVKTANFSVGFEPKLFIIAIVNGIQNAPTNTLYITTFWHCADLDGKGYGAYSGGLAVKTTSSAGECISYDARSFYTYSNGVVTINDSSHYFASGKLYRVFAMA